MLKNSKVPFSRKGEGFTIVEMIVVTGVTIVLASVVFTFGSPAREQVALSVEQARLSQVILRAKSLAVATFNQPPVPCGYGVAVDYADNSYAIFSYEKYISGQRKRDCRNIATIDTNNNPVKFCGPGDYDEDDPPYGTDPDKYPLTCYQELSRYKVPMGLTLDGSGAAAMDFVLFRPPDPATLLFPAAAARTVAIRSSSGGRRTITVNSAGQLSFE